MTELATIHAALTWGHLHLQQADALTEPRDASILLEYVLGVARATIIAHPERPIPAAQADAYRALITRRAAGVPIAQLTGERAFYRLDFYVTPDVLIPRPETEHLIEAALAWARGRDAVHGAHFEALTPCTPSPSGRGGETGDLGLGTKDTSTKRTQANANLRFVDVGTGSGAIAVTLAHELPAARGWAVDVSAAALTVAQKNAARHGVAERITFIEGDLLAPLIAAGQTVEVIAANLPYIPSDEVATLEVAKHEPLIALDGGADGLDLIRRLLDQAPSVLAGEGDGLILLEFAAAQGERVRDLAAAAFPAAQVDIMHDLAGHDRLVRVVR